MKLGQIAVTTILIIMIIIHNFVVDLQILKLKVWISNKIKAIIITPKYIKGICLRSTINLNLLLVIFYTHLVCLSVEASLSPQPTILPQVMIYVSVLVYRRDVSASEELEMKYETRDVGGKQKINTKSKYPWRTELHYCASFPVKL